MKTTYSIVVESGSCSPDYKRWEEKANCGHAHNFKPVESSDLEEVNR